MACAPHTQAGGDVEWLSDWSTWWKILAAIGTGLGLFPTPKRAVLRAIGHVLLWQFQLEKKVLSQARELGQKDLVIRSLERTNRAWERDYGLMVAATERSNERVSSLALLLESAVSSVVTTTGTDLPTILETLDPPTTHGDAPMISKTKSIAI